MKNRTFLTTAARRLFPLSVIAGTLLSVVANAAVIQLVPHGTSAFSTFYISKNGTGIGGGNSNSSDDNLFRLNTYFLTSQIVPTASLKPGTQTFNWSGGGLAGWDYAVVHYGGGAFGGSGGTIGAWKLNGENKFSFPEQSFSSIDLFRGGNPPPPPGVPDGGTTLVSLGVALLGLGSMRKLLAAKA